MRMSKVMSVAVLSLVLMWALTGIGGQNPGEARCVPCTRGNPELSSYHGSYGWGGDALSYEQLIFWYLSVDYAEIEEPDEEELLSRRYWDCVWRCVVSICGPAVVACRWAGPAWWKCALAVCGTGIAVCLVICI